MANKARLTIRTLDLAIMDALEAYTHGEASPTEAAIAVYSTVDSICRTYDHVGMAWEIKQVVNSHMFSIQSDVMCGVGCFLMSPRRIKFLCDHGIYPVVDDDRVLCADGDEIVDVTYMTFNEIRDFLGY